MPHVAVGEKKEPTALRFGLNCRRIFLRVSGRITSRAAASLKRVMRKKLWRQPAQSATIACNVRNRVTPFPTRSRMEPLRSARAGSAEEWKPETCVRAIPLAPPSCDHIPQLQLPLAAVVGLRGRIECLDRSGRSNI